MSDGYSFRMAHLADTEWISRARARMFLDMGGGPESDVVAGAIHFARWADEEMAAGNYLAWVVESAGERVACAGVWLKPRQPDPKSGKDIVPYVLNVHCEPEHRRRGLARQLMDWILAWASAYGFETVELHTSDDGRALYEALGFVPTTEMRLSLPRPER